MPKILKISKWPAHSHEICPALKAPPTPLSLELLPNSWWKLAAAPPSKGLGRGLREIGAGSRLEPRATALCQRGLRVKIVCALSFWNIFYSVLSPHTLLACRLNPQNWFNHLQIRQKKNKLQWLAKYNQAKLHWGPEQKGKVSDEGAKNITITLQELTCMVQRTQGQAWGCPGSNPPLRYTQLVPCSHMPSSFAPSSEAKPRRPCTHCSRGNSCAHQTKGLCREMTLQSAISAVAPLPSATHRDLASRYPEVVLYPFERKKVKNSVAPSAYRPLSQSTRTHQMATHI